MKKFLLLAVVFCTMFFSANAQGGLIGSQGFADGIGNGWTTVTNADTSKWIWKKNNIATKSYGSIVFNGRTAADGFAIIISDDKDTVNTDLISPLMDCTGKAKVGLEFYQLFGGSVLTKAGVYVSTDGTTWTKVYTTVNGQNPQRVKVDITSQAAGQDSLYVKFSYASKDDFMWVLDDIKITDLISNDAAMVKVNVADYSAITKEYLVECIFENTGSNTLADVTLNYTIDGGAPVSAPFNVNLAPGASQEYTFSTATRVSQPGVHKLAIYTSLPNGEDDLNTYNDTMVKEVVFMGYKVKKNVLLEEFTTAPCIYCPGAATYVDQLMETEGGYTIPVAHHSGFSEDAMTLDEGETLMLALGKDAPKGSIDRIVVPGFSNPISMGLPGLDFLYDGGNWWMDAVVARKPTVTPLSIEATNTYDPISRQVNINIATTFFGRTKGDLRVNCYIIEDSVTGVGAGYNQKSIYYNSPANPDLNPWYQVGTYANGQATIAGYVHRKVVRAFLSGVWGNTGIIPAVTADTAITYNKTYTYNIPDGVNGFDDKQVTIVAFVSNYNPSYISGLNEVLNSVEMKLNGVVINEPQAIVLSGIEETPNSLANISLYPNPASSRVFVEYTLKTDAKVSFDVYNTMGQLVDRITDTKVAAGSYTTAINTGKLNTGVYFVTMKDNGTALQTLKFVVSK